MAIEDREAMAAQRSVAPTLLALGRSGFGPRQVFWGFLGLQVATWTLIPALVTDNASLDVIEGLAWGHEWQWGYHKGPPLFAWLLELAASLGGTSLWPIFLLSQSCLALMFYGVWRLGSAVLDEASAALAVLMLATIYYFNFPTPEFNPIVLEFPFTAFLGWIAHRALKRDRLGDWVLVGLLAALGMMSRYSTATLLIPIALFMLNLPEARRRFAGPGPYVAVLVGLVALAPHLLWMREHGYQSVAYIQDRARIPAAPFEGVVFAARFTISQFLALAPVALLILTLLPFTRRQTPAIAGQAPTPDIFDRLYVSVLAWGPFLFSILISIATGRGLRSMWGAPLWVGITLWAVMLLRPSFTAERLRRFRLAWAALFLLPVIGYAGAQTIGPNLTGHERRTHFPGAALARMATTAWHDAYGMPLRYVVGRMWVAGNIAFYSDDRPSVFTDADRRISPWIDERDLSRQGGLVVWNVYVDGEAMPAWLAKRFPGAIVEPMAVLPLARVPTLMPVKVRWALLPPSGCDGEACSKPR